MTEAPHKVHLAMLVNRCATPLAVLLVTLGVWVSQPRPPVRNLSIFLLLFGIAFNALAVYALPHLKGFAPFFIKARLVINLGVNVVLVYVLGGYWPPMWLLLALTPMATAVYESKGKTLFAAVGVSAVLLVIHATRQLDAPIDWGQQLAQGIFIILISLMINDIAHLHLRGTPAPQK